MTETPWLLRLVIAGTETPAGSLWLEVAAFVPGCVGCIRRYGAVDPRRLSLVFVFRFGISCCLALPASAFSDV